MKPRKPAPAMADDIPVHCAHSAIVPIKTLKPHPRNPNKHPRRQIELFARVVKKQGWRAPIVVSSRSGLIIKGHGRLEVAKFLGCEHVPVDEQAYTSEAQEWQDLVADNRLAELSSRDENSVTSILRDLESRGENAELAGFTGSEINRLLARMQQSQADPAPLAPDYCAIAQKTWNVKTGQVWQLGDHRLACGDATDSGVWQALMQGQLAQLVNTDPPYGVAYEDAAGVGIQGDELRQDDLAKLVRQAMALAIKHSRDDAGFYIWHASSTRRDFEYALDQVGLQERQYITWVKDSFVLGRADYHWQTEPVFFCEKAGQRARWFGDRTQATVWRVSPSPTASCPITLANGLLITDGAGAILSLAQTRPKNAKVRHLRLGDGETLHVGSPRPGTAWEVQRDPRSDYIHPTQKPVALARIPVENSSGPGGIVVDCFGGGGFTLLACEQTGRAARVIEKEPRFAAGQLQRWVDMTGKMPAIAP